MGREMLTWLQTLGLWNWLLIGLVLVGGELVLPGVYIIWFGAGALATALVSAILAPVFSVFGFWQLQIFLFCLFSIVFVLIGRNLAARRRPREDNPLLNRRTDTMIGQIARLEEGIENGHGHIRLGDSLWRVTGADLPAGHRVRLIAFDEGAFIVEEVGES